MQPLPALSRRTAVGSEVFALAASLLTPGVARWNARRLWGVRAI